MNCVHCGRRLVFVAIAVHGFVLKTWMCDCRYRNPADYCITPPGLVADIVRAREFDDGAVVIDAEKLRE